MTRNKKAYSGLAGKIISCFTITNLVIAQVFIAGLFVFSITASAVVEPTDTGWISPTQNAADSGGDKNGFEMNPEFAYVDDSNYASNINGDNDNHRFYGYNFGLPANAIILGIEVRIDWWLDDVAGTNKMNVDLSWDGGSHWTSPVKSDTEETISEHTGILGGSVDSWGRQWLPGQFAVDKFRVRLKNSLGSDSRDSFLDWVGVKVYYRTDVYSPTGFVPGGQFVNKDRVYVPDEKEASEGANGHIQQYRNFNIPSFPAGATIKGIEVLIDGRSNNDSGTNRRLEASFSWDNGANFTGARQTGNLGANPSLEVLGSPTDTWGRSWGASDFSNTNLIVKLKAVLSNGTVYIDWLGVRVYYEVNQPPVVADRNITLDEDTTIGITLSAVDSDGPSSLTYIITSNPAHGTLSGTAPNLTYTPAENYNGPDSFAFKANDGAADSEEATISITVTPVNDPPVLVSIGGKEVDELAVLSFVAVSTDVDGGAPVYSLAGFVPSGASIDSLTGLFVWTPTEEQGPGVYIFDVVVSDGNGGTASEIITVVVNEVNVAPVLYEIGNKTVLEGNLLEFFISAFDIDIPANNLVYSVIGLPGEAVFGIRDSSWTFSWIPTFEQAGNYSVEFIVFDGLSQDNEIVPIDVGNVNTTPSLVSIGDKIIDENRELVFTVFASDLDGDSLSYSAENLPSGAAFDAETRTFNWVPNYSQAGLYEVDFTVSDSGGLGDAETVKITVVNVNRVPEAASQQDENAVVTDEDTAVNITLSATDADGDTLAYFIVSNPSNGSLGAISETELGVLVTYTPDKDYNGPDSFEFQAYDGQDVSNVATVNITVNLIDEPAVSMSTPTSQAVSQQSSYVGAPASMPVPAPSGASAIATPGSGGGVVLAADGAEIRVIVPPQAVSADTVFSIAPAPSGTFGNPDPSAGLIKIGNRIYEISAIAGNSPVTVFSQPLSIIFTYADGEISGVEETDLAIYWWDESSGQWVKLDSQVDALNNRITASVDHLTVFALMVFKAPVVETLTPLAPSEEGMIAGAATESETQESSTERIAESAPEEEISVEGPYSAREKSLFVRTYAFAGLILLGREIAGLVLLGIVISIAAVLTVLAIREKISFRVRKNSRKKF